MIGPIKSFYAIGPAERELVANLMDGGLLSGYLAGHETGGYYVRALEEKWAETIGAKHAIACNSATSGLHAAAFAVGLRRGDHFVCSAMTMSATAAAPMFTGADPIFSDVEDEYFGLVCGAMPDTTKAIITTNLFGHASQLGRYEWVKNCGIYLIEDNSQSPFATAHGRYCGTAGHIGVFSFNVHKHLQCGEGGMLVTDDEKLATRLRAFINHGENSGGPIGLNLRMPELCAVVALSQLGRAKEIIQDRVDQAEALIAAIGDIPGIRPPMVYPGCTHVYYAIPFLMEPRPGTGDSDVNPFDIIRNLRRDFCAALRAQGVPIVEGYQEPLYRLPVFKRYARPCPIAEDLQHSRLFYFENCAWDLTPSQIVQVGEAFKKAAREVL